jgi:hypothetical protein
MDPGGGCPYVQGSIEHVARANGDGLGRWSGEDFGGVRDGVEGRVVRREDPRERRLKREIEKAFSCL